jgi:hypothetical protein
MYGQKQRCVEGFGGEADGNRQIGKAKLNGMLY